MNDEQKTKTPRELEDELAAAYLRIDAMNERVLHWFKQVKPIREAIVLEREMCARVAELHAIELS